MKFTVLDKVPGHIGTVTFKAFKTLCINMNVFFCVCMCVQEKKKGRQRGNEEGRKEQNSSTFLKILLLNPYLTMSIKVI